MHMYMHTLWLLVDLLVVVVVLYMYMETYMYIHIVHILHVHSSAFTCSCCSLTISGSHRDLPVRVHNADGGTLSQRDGVVLDGRLQVAVPVLPVLQWYTHCRLHGGAHWLWCIGVLDCLSWRQGGGGEKGGGGYHVHRLHVV